MTINEIIESMPKPPNIEFVLELPYYISWYWLGFNAIVLTVLCMSVYEILKKKPSTTKEMNVKEETIFNIGWKIIACLVISYMCFIIIYNYTLREPQNINYKKEMQIWENQVVIPYIQTLKDTKSPIISLDMTYKPTYLDTLLKDKTKYAILNNDTDNKQKIKIKYIQNGINEDIDYFNIVMDLKPNEKPYLISKYVSQDITDVITKGNYYGTIHVPTDYIFHP